MFFALDKNGQKVMPRPKMAATCPICLQPVIAKCGKIVVWHWAHQVGKDCDSWSEPETYWHRDWKNLFDKVEVTIEKMGQRHRADIVTPHDRVIELQHSNISPEQIGVREKFYGQMIWVFDIQDAYENDRLLLEDRTSHVTFRWKHPKKSILAARRPVYLDLDGYWLLELRKMYGGTPCGGWGHTLTKSQFVARYTE